MQRINKRKLDIQDKQTLLFKETDVIIKVAEQVDFVTMWYKTNDNINEEILCEKVIYIRGTGHNLGDAEYADYFDTVIMRNGLAWHIFIKEL